MGKMGRTTDTGAAQENLRSGASQRLLSQGSERHMLSSEQPLIFQGLPFPSQAQATGPSFPLSCTWASGSLAMLGKGYGAGREEEGPASAGLSYPAAGCCALPGGRQGRLCAAGLPAPAPTEPPGAGSAASQWSPAKGEDSYEKRKTSTRVLKFVL